MLESLDYPLRALAVVAPERLISNPLPGGVARSDDGRVTPGWGVFECTGRVQILVPIEERFLSVQLFHT